MFLNFGYLVCVKLFLILVRMKGSKFILWCLNGYKYTSLAQGHHPTRRPGLRISGLSRSDSHSIQSLPSFGFIIWELQKMKILRNLGLFPPPKMTVFSEDHDFPHSWHISKGFSRDKVLWKYWLSISLYVVIRVLKQWAKITVFMRKKSIFKRAECYSLIDLFCIA